MAKRTTTTKKKTAQEDVLMVTQSGYDEMVRELEERKDKVSEIANEIDEARRLGDLSENEPYAAAMQKKELNDSRIDELEYLVSIAQISESEDNDVIGIGSKVEIERTDTKSKKTINVVGRQESGEADPRAGKISIDSPLGQALNMKRVGDVVVVDLPTGKAEYKVKKVA